MVSHAQNLIPKEMSPHIKTIVSELCLILFGHIGIQGEVERKSGLYLGNNCTDWVEFFVRAEFSNLVLQTKFQLITFILAENIG